MTVTEPNGKVYQYGTMTETRLVHLAKEGHKEAYDEIYNRYGKGIQSHVTGIIKDPREAEDITQIIFGEKLPKNVKKLSDEAGNTQQPIYLRAWLHTVATRMSFNISRDKRRRTIILERYEGNDESYEETIITELYDYKRRESIAKALDKVNKDHKIILKLRYEADLSYAEIAKKLKLKLGTVMSRLSRARGSLRESAPELEELLD